MYELEGMHGSLERSGSVCTAGQSELSRGGERGGNQEGCRGYNGRTEVDAKSVVPPACKMQMPHSNILYVRTCTNCILRTQVVRQLILLGVVVTNKIYPWSGLCLGRAWVTRCTLLAHCTSRIMSGVNVELATLPFFVCRTFSRQRRQRS